MKVIENEPRFWFLLSHNDDFYIDVNCNVSAFGFSMLVKLNNEELTQFKSNGREYINSLAENIQYYSQSKYKNRHTLGEIGKLVHEVIMEFNNQNKAPNNAYKK